MPFRFRPPSAETVAKRGPLALVALAVPIVAFAAASLCEQITDEEKKEQVQEADRRAEIVRDMINTLENVDGKKEDDDDESKSESVPDADDYDDVDQIEYSTLREKCSELAEIQPGAKELEAGVEWCGKLLLKELQTAATKTEAQKDVRYSDGRRLEGLLDCPLDLDQLCREARFGVSHTLRMDIRRAFQRGYEIQLAQKRKDVLKAIKMVFIAWETLPWLCASNAMSTLASMVSTMALHYRSEALQALKVSNSRAPFYRATFVMLIIELLAGMCKTLETQLASRVDRVMAKSLQVRLFLALLSKDIVWWGEQKESYKYAWMVINLPMEVQNALETPRTIVNTITSVCIQAELVRQKSSQMLWAMIALHWFHFFIRKGINFVERQFNKYAMAGMVCVTEDQMTWVQAINPEYIQMFQSFCRGPLEAKNLIKYTRCRNRFSDVRGAVDAVIAPVRSLANQAINIVEYLGMGNLVQRGSMDLTEAETTLHYASDVGNKLEGAYYSVGNIKNKFGALARAYDFISIPSKLEPSEGIDPGVRAKGHFVFEDVKFAYPGRKVSVLKGVNFEVQPGQAVGITGSTGCGKSTCLRLVERFYDVTGGRIILDGVDIRKYSLDWLRSQIVTVVQDPKLLPFSIRENLTFGCATTPAMERIEEACRSANIWDVLRDPQKFPNGLETQMSAIGNVSGGEKQRICIARAILADPPILLLDEATSALDEVSQAHVQEALTKLMKGRTTLVIAHRLSTIKDSDKIICMEDGKAVDNGTHRELLAKPDSVWKRLWDQQNAEDTDGKADRKRSKQSAVGRYDSIRAFLSMMAETPDDIELVKQGAEQIEACLEELESADAEDDKDEDEQADENQKDGDSESHEAKGSDTQEKGRLAAERENQEARDENES